MHVSIKLKSIRILQIIVSYILVNLKVRIILLYWFHKHFHYPSSLFHHLIMFLNILHERKEYVIENNLCDDLPHDISVK